MQHQATPAPLIGPSIPASQLKPSQPASPEATRQKLQQAIQSSNDVLFTATTALQLFPDTITVDRSKITITRRKFVGTAEVLSFRIEDILNVHATVGPFLGRVMIISRVFSTDTPQMVGKFWRSDAMRLKRIIQGYVIATQNQIDCTALSIEDLVNMLDELGQDEHPAAAPPPLMER
jgi:hypothetical protein